MTIEAFHPPEQTPKVSPPQPSPAEVSEGVSTEKSGENPELTEALPPLQLDTKTPDHPEPREEMVEGDRVASRNENRPFSNTSEGLVPPESALPDDAELHQLQARIQELRFTEQSLQQQIDRLQQEADRLQTQIAQDRSTLGQLVQAGLKELEQRKQKLEMTIQKLEERAETIRQEMRKNFAGVSQDLAIRIQGFKDYLVGSLQDLASAAENLELAAPSVPEAPPLPHPEAKRRSRPTQEEDTLEPPQFGKSKFTDQVRQIRYLIDQYRTRPDYYGPAWQLRRTFEPIHAERVSQWFFSQGGRGAVRTMGTRLQNILVASAVISILYNLYGDRLRPLILVNTPERLGEWRRGLQDCLGISRSDFSSEQGITMFEAPEPLAAKADRITQQKQLPLIIIDESEEKVSLAMLQFPLWLAFAPSLEAPPMVIDNW